MSQQLSSRAVALAEGWRALLCTCASTAHTAHTRTRTHARGHRQRSTAQTLSQKSGQFLPLMRRGARISPMEPLKPATVCSHPNVQQWMVAAGCCIRFENAAANAAAKTERLEVRHGAAEVGAHQGPVELLRRCQPAAAQWRLGEQRPSVAAGGGNRRVGCPAGPGGWRAR